MSAFKVDENLPLEIVHALRAAGYDAHSIYDEKLGGARDRRIYEASVQEGRAIVTLDLDFDIRRYPPSQHRGIIVFRPHIQGKPNVIRLFDRAITTLDRTN
ncbi:MAG TPA: DUF5615 family PIN-like protein [Phycisphaerae bacterium]|nr:DUF5615 family PIN-like protein [Phycisphaerae bacterium]